MVQSGLPRVSVIMAAYNAEPTIRAAISSVRNQTFQDWELLVVDDCSKDGTAAVVRELAASDPRIRLIAQKRNGGVCAARKLALENARGEWIAILDSDDLWRPEKLSVQLDKQWKTGADLLYTASGFIESDGSPIDWILHVPERMTLRRLLKQNRISNSSALVRKALYRDHYIAEEHVHEDFAMWISMLKSGVTAIGTDEPLLIYRLSKSSRSGNHLRALKMNWNTYAYSGISLPARVWYMFCSTVLSVFKFGAIRLAKRG